MFYERKQARKAERRRKEIVLKKRKSLEKAAPALLDACEKWSLLSEKLKDRLTGDECAEIGLYQFDHIVEAAIAATKKER